MVDTSDKSIVRPRCRQLRPPSARSAFRGALFTVWQWEQTLFDGRSAKFEVLQRPDTVLVVPVIDNSKVLLIRESQPGMEPALQAIGGRIESNESPKDAARRELLEETGCTAGELRLWDAWQPVAKLDWAIYLFVAHSVQQVSRPSTDPGERIEICTRPINDLLVPEHIRNIDDYELRSKLYFACCDVVERERVLELLRSKQ